MFTGSLIVRIGQKPDSMKFKLDLADNLVRLVLLGLLILVGLTHEELLVLIA
jgi:hypothetical protein